MVVDLSERQIQVLYEVSLAIRPKTDVTRTAESALSTYLQKLNCSAAAVFETTDAAGLGEPVTALPDRRTFDGAIGATRDRLGQTPPPDLPLVDEVAPDTYRYVMSLPEYGVLLLLRRGSPLPDGIVRSLGDLNAKLATACNRVAVQREYETQYRELFSDAPVMFVLTREADGDAVIDDCNERFASKLGYTVPELTGRPLASCYAATDTGDLRSEGYQAALAGQFGTGERALVAKDGSRVVTTVRATPRLDENGDVVGTLAIFLDVTEAKRRSVQVSVLNRVLRHNIRTDLSVVRGRIESLLGDDDELRPHLEAMYDRTDDLLSTAETARRIQRLLDDTGRHRHEMGALLDSLVPELRGSYPEATIERRRPDAPVAVSATDGLEWALEELIRNACEHAGDAPTVTVAVRDGRTTASVTVADDGPGIPAPERRIVGAGPETDLEHGSGMGLWLVYWTVETSGGDLQFDGDDGAAVRMTLPRADRAAFEAE
jgi:PAS domain S-box-containing protein